MCVARCVALLSLGTLVLACGDDPTARTDDPLPDGAHVLPNGDTPFVLLPLTLAGEESSATVSLFSGGSDDLLLTDVCLEPQGGPGDCSAPLAGSSFTTNGAGGTTVESRDIVAIEVTFAPAARGVESADLIVLSNAENFPSLRFSIFAPAALAPLQDAPDLESAATVVDAEAVGTERFTFVRLFNLGGAMAEITGLDVVDDGDAAFSFPANSTLPNIACVTGTCGGTLPADCQPVRVGSGDFRLVPVQVTAGPHTASLEITSNDADGCPLSIDLNAGP